MIAPPGTFRRAAARLASLAGQGLGWRPDEFWRATPVELALILAPHGGAELAPLARADLARMMEHDDDRSG